MTKEDELRAVMDRAMELLGTACPGVGFVILGAEQHEESNTTRILTVDNMDPETVIELFEICAEQADFIETDEQPQKNRMN